MKRLLLLLFSCVLFLQPYFQAQPLTSEESPVTLSTATGDIKGRLLLPANATTCPVVLLIAGSGPTDMDGNNPMMKNNSLKFLAEGLAQKGIASLRFDKRGIAGSAAAGKEESKLRFEDYVNDVTGWIDFLAKDKRFTDITVAGHSEGSLIGMLLENHGAYSVVESNQMGIMQHDPFSWQVTDGAFHTLEEISSGAKYMNKTLNSWITGMSIDERIRLVDVLYGLLTAGNIENVFDAGDIQKNIGAIYNAAMHLDPEMRSFVLQIIRQLAGFALHNIPHPNVPENLNILPGNKTQN